MIKEYIKIGFDEAIRASYEDTEKRKFLLNHERKHLCIDNLTREIKKANTFINVKDTQFHEIIADFALMFCVSAIEERDQKNLSNVEKYRRNKEYWDAEEKIKEWEKEEAEHFEQPVSPNAKRV